jgi:diadenosine tetraphosphatase ApaH/serine/threonine PP2A family protein phosphatase
MLAFLSDVHANLEALQAVLRDIDRHPVEAVFCLGDTIGYGPDPCACLDLVVRTCAGAVQGNHDNAAFFNDNGFCGPARRALRWTRQRLHAADGDPLAARRRWALLAHSPYWLRGGDLLLVHGSPRGPLSEYVYPGDAADPDKMAALLGPVRWACFAGHTHVPGVFTEEAPGERYRFRGPGRDGPVFALDGHKALVNVGSVGQPRDGDWRACYVLFDGETVRFRRVTYDVRTTIRKIRATDGLDDYLAQRLRLGR